MKYETGKIEDAHQGVSPWYEALIQVRHIPNWFERLLRCKGETHAYYGRTFYPYQSNWFDMNNREVKNRVLRHALDCTFAEMSGLFRREKESL